MRILYVALTRGERELLVVATADGETAPPAAQSARCPLDWILPAAEAFAVERLTEVPRLRAAQRPTFARLAQEADPREMEELAHRLDYRYPYEDQVKQPQRAAPPPWAQPLRNGWSWSAPDCGGGRGIYRR